ncbi:MAG: hypothetical protein J6D08_04215 [Lachnospiraceae bacterium]|nr:hypothetical protein [Lachnospiraceae bacterium]
MFCVIQEVEVKTVPAGEPKGIEVYESRRIVNGQEFCSYEYRNSAERFERPIRKSYRISIHESYRENGKVKKKQTVICTIGYYEVVDWGSWIGDYINGGLKKKADILGITENELCNLIYGKWQPIIDRVLAEFQQTEEYKAKKEKQRIINEHNQRVGAFTEKYGVTRSEYNRCYDVFGKLRNPEYLKKIEADFKARKEYESWSREESRSYYKNSYSNHGGYNSGSYCDSSASNYNEADKAMLKKFYRTLSKAFHPDSNPDKDTSEEMKMLNRLKSRILKNTNIRGLY